MKKFYALPTYVITKLLMPFLPDDNKIKRDNPTLQQWHDCQTNACRAFDFAFAASFAYIIVLIVWIAYA